MKVILRVKGVAKLTQTWEECAKSGYRYIFGCLGYLSNIYHQNIPPNHIWSSYGV